MSFELFKDLKSRPRLFLICLGLGAVMSLAAWGVVSHIHMTNALETSKRAKAEAESKEFELKLRLQKELAKAELKAKEEAYEKTYREAQQKSVYVPPSPTSTSRPTQNNVSNADSVQEPVAHQALPRNVTKSVNGVSVRFSSGGRSQAETYEKRAYARIELGQSPCSNFSLAVMEYANAYADGDVTAKNDVLRITSLARMRYGCAYVGR